MSVDPKGVRKVDRIRYTQAHTETPAHTHTHTTPTKPALLKWGMTVPQGTFDQKAWRHLRCVVDEALVLALPVSGQACSSVL